MSLVLVCCFPASSSHILFLLINKKIKVQEVLVSETSTHWLPKVQRSWDRGPRSRVRKLVSHVPARTSIYIYIFVCPSCLVTISINQPSKSFRKFKVYSNNLISIVISLSVSLKTIILVLLLSFLYESSY